jgi:tetratricopeptide (TPR) repeat protein
LLDLSRARKHNRAQYLRIQAVHLARVGKYREALELLDEFIRDYSHDIGIAQAHCQRAEAFCKLGQADSAIEAYRASLDVQRTRRTVQTQAWLDFPWFILQQGLKHLYDEAARILEEFGDGYVFGLPIEEYRYFGAKAMLADHLGNADDAMAFARKALTASVAKRSRFQFHPSLGLVRSPHEEILKRLRRLAK